VPETGSAELGPSVFGQAHARLADEFDKVAVDLGDGITPDAGLVAGVEEVVRGASRSFYGKGQVSADAKRLLELVSKGANGRDLMGWRSEMVTEMRDAARAEGKGAYAADLRGLIGVLDDFIGRYARDNPRLVDTATGEIADVAGRWNAARDQFRMLATLESSGVVNPRGEIVAGTLFRRLQQDYPAEFLRGDMYGSATPAVLDLMDAARISARFGDIVGNSGTATRQTLSEFIRAPSVGGLMGVAVSQTGGRMVRGVVRNRARRAVLEGYRDAMGKALAERAIAAQAARAAVAGAGGDQ
jgi:hypothetical protein